VGWGIHNPEGGRKLWGEYPGTINHWVPDLLANVEKHGKVGEKKREEKGGPGSLICRELHG